MDRILKYYLHIHRLQRVKIKLMSLYNYNNCTLRKHIKQCYVFIIKMPLNVLYFC
jgi:hypothetical protein